MDGQEGDESSLSADEYDEYADDSNPPPGGFPEAADGELEEEASPVGDLVTKASTSAQVGSPFSTGGASLLLGVRANGKVLRCLGF